MLWAGALTANGYAMVSVKNSSGKWSTAVLHRQLYLVEIGDVPEGLVLDHLCGNRSCINTAHLEAITNAENLNRGIRSNVYGTHCNNGHDLSIVRFYVDKKNRKSCKQCKKDKRK